LTKLRNNRELVKHYIWCVCEGIFKAHWHLSDWRRATLNMTGHWWPGQNKKKKNLKVEKRVSCPCTSTSTLSCLALGLTLRILNIRLKITKGLSLVLRLFRLGLNHTTDIVVFSAF
jgi:hypothetical protein